MANNTPHIVGGGLGTFRKLAQENHAQRVALTTNKRKATHILAVEAMAKSVKPKGVSLTKVHAVSLAK